MSVLHEPSERGQVYYFVGHIRGQDGLFFFMCFLKYPIITPVAMLVEVLFRRRRKALFVRIDCQICLDTLYEVLGRYSEEERGMPASCAEFIVVRIVPFLARNFLRCLHILEP